VAIELADTPLLFNFAEGGKTPPIPLERLRGLGYRIVILPIGAPLAATTAVGKLAAKIQAHGAFGNSTVGTSILGAMIAAAASPVIA
jgi:2-methylisocitrate lyase-like PEP mutase family enzyme